jgi:hypothetical protein
LSSTDELGANDSDVSYLCLIGWIQPAALLQGKKTDAGYLRFGAERDAAAAPVFTHQADVITGDNRTGRADVGCPTEVNVILVCQLVPATGLLAASDNGRASRKDEHHVLANLGKASLIP